MCDIARFLKLIVSSQNAQIPQVTVDVTQHIPLTRLHPTTGRSLRTNKKVGLTNGLDLHRQASVKCKTVPRKVVGGKGSWR